MIKAAIIDDGYANEPFLNISHWFVDENCTVCKDLDVAVLGENRRSHSTQCLAIINHYYRERNVKWYSIRVLDPNTRRGNVACFLCALDFCREIGINVLHLSIGSRCFGDFTAIQEHIDSLAQTGTIIVAALNNWNTVTYPACLPNVIGVRASDKLKGQHYLIRPYPFDGIDFEASSVHFLRSIREITPISNSYAAPVITARILEIVSIEPSLSREEVFARLISHADNAADVPSDFCYLPKLIGNICNAICINVGTDCVDMIGISKTINLHSLDKDDIKTEDFISCHWVLFNTDSTLSPLKKIKLVECMRYILEINSHCKVAACQLKSDDLTLLTPEEKKRVWCFKPLPTDHRMQHKTQVPLVGFRGFFGHQLFKLFPPLVSMFLESDYYCKAIFNSAQAALYGYDILPDGDDIASLLTSYTDFYRCSIVLLGLTRNNPLSADIHCDLTITPPDFIESGDIVYDGQEPSWLFEALLKAFAE